MVMGPRYTSSTSSNNHSRRKHRQESSALASALADVESVFREADARKGEAYRRGIRPDTITFIEHGPLRVLLSSTPTTSSLPTYVQTLRAHDVTHVVRVCEPYYEASALQSYGLEHHDWAFSDGEYPPQHVVYNWLQLLDDVFELRRYSSRYPSASTVHSAAATQSGDDSSVAVAVSGFAESSDCSSLNPSPCSSTDGVTSGINGHGNETITSRQLQQEKKKTVAIHCAAGIGRAPVLVAMALMELGLSAHEAVGWLRGVRRGAINGKQYAFLLAYTPRPPLEKETPSNSTKCRRSRSPFSSFWPSLRRARSPPSPSSSSSSTITSGTRREKRASHDRSVVWNDEKRASHPTPSTPPSTRASHSTSHSSRASPSNSSPASSHYGLKAMRKAQLARGRYVSM